MRFLLFISATTPATCGAAIDVPELGAQCCPLSTGVLFEQHAVKDHALLTHCRKIAHLSGLTRSEFTCSRIAARRDKPPTRIIVVIGVRGSHLYGGVARICRIV